MPVAPTSPIPNLPFPPGVMFPTQEITDATGAITIPCGFVVLNRAGVIAATLAAPTTNGQWLVIVSETAQAHTLDLASTGINGSAADVGTWGGAIGDGVALFSHGSEWYSFGTTNVTWA